jgi:hypothetical protein
LFFRISSVERALHCIIQSMPVNSKTEKLTVKVPEDHVVVHKSGPDFDTYRIIPLRPISLFGGEIVVSVDSYPDKSMPPDATAKVDGKLLGKSVVWRGKRSARGGFLAVTEPLPKGGPTLVPVDGNHAIVDDHPRYAQVVVMATRQDKFLDQLRAVAETLAIEKR